MSNEAPKTGVIFAREDCLGVARRLLIDLVDVLVASISSIAVILIAYLVGGSEFLWQGGSFLIWAVVWFCYFVLLKGSRYRTFGYVLTKAKIVNLQGERPSFGQLFIRFLFSVFGPLNFVIDLLWIPSDPSRQALRDKFAGTHVVRGSAIPVGQGRIVFVPYTMFGQSYIFREVRETPSVAAP